MSDRFWSSVQIGAPDECWPWTGYCSGKGYGRVRLTRGSTTHAHRMAFFFHHKKMPGEHMVCHSCDNPPCCNPRHLFLGDAAANNRDKMRKGRARGCIQRGERNHNARLTSREVAAIRQRLACGDTNVAVADDYDVTHSMVSRIRLGKAWQS